MYAESVRILHIRSAGAWICVSSSTISLLIRGLLNLNVHEYRKGRRVRIGKTRQNQHRDRLSPGHSEPPASGARTVHPLPIQARLGSVSLHRALLDRRLGSAWPRTAHPGDSSATERACGLRGEQLASVRGSDRQVFASSAGQITRIRNQVCTGNVSLVSGKRGKRTRGQDQASSRSVRGKRKRTGSTAGFVGGSGTHG